MLPARALRWGFPRENRSGSDLVVRGPQMATPKVAWDTSAGSANVRSSLRKRRANASDTGVSARVVVDASHGGGARTCVVRVRWPPTGELPVVSGDVVVPRARSLAGQRGAFRRRLAGLRPRSAFPLPPAVGLARHSSLGRRACPCLGWRSRATGQRSLGSPLCAPRRQPGGFPRIPLRRRTSAPAARGVSCQAD